MTILRDAWFSQVLGREVFSLVDLPGRGVLDPEALRREIDDHAAGHPGAFYYAKVPAERADLLAALAGAGLVAIDVNVSFAYEGDPVRDSTPPDGVSVDVAGPEDREGVLAVAETSFVYTRFHLRRGHQPTLVASAR